MSETYARCYGMDKISPWRMQCITVKCCDLRFETLQIDSSLHVKNLSEIDWTKIHAYDAKVVPNLSRKAYLEAFLTQAESFTKVGEEHLHVVSA